MYLFKTTSVWFAFLETGSMWVVKETFSEVITSRYLAQRTDSKMGWDIWLL